MASKEMAIVAGDKKALAFELAWEQAVAGGTADEASRGSLLAWVDGTPVWTDAEASGVRGVSWSLVEILEHLAWAWPYLRLEECDPLGLGTRPDHVRSEAEKRWLEMPEAERVSEQRLVRAYEDCHDLASAFQGLWLPSLWVQRMGRSCCLVSDGSEVRTDFDGVLDALRNLGENISGRLEIVEDPRAIEAVASWRRRESTSRAELLKVATGLSGDILREIAGKKSAERLFEWEGSYDPGELVAVARMAGHALPPSEMSKVLARLGSIGASACSLLDRLSDQAMRFFQGLVTERSYDQGYSLARWLREEHLGLEDAQRVEPRKVLDELGVNVEEIEIQSPKLDAVCVWGTNHGPVLLLNNKGKHGQSVAGRRATHAHEICHLLIDRKGALPVAEVLGGRLPTAIEARARAFAAELLIPKEVAGSAFAANGDDKATMRSLTMRYGASREIVAWQAKNSDVFLDPSTMAFLREHVSQPYRF